MPVLAVALGQACARLVDAVRQRRREARLFSPGASLSLGEREALVDQGGDALLPRARPHVVREEAVVVSHLRLLTARSPVRAPCGEERHEL